jgi:hypothetical protein
VRVCACVWQREKGHNVEVLEGLMGVMGGEPLRRRRALAQSFLCGRTCVRACMRACARVQVCVRVN